MHRIITVIVAFGLVIASASPASGTGSPESCSSRLPGVAWRSAGSAQGVTLYSSGPRSTGAAQAILPAIRDAAPKFEDAFGPLSGTADVCLAENDGVLIQSGLVTGREFSGTAFAPSRICFVAADTVNVAGAAVHEVAHIRASEKAETESQRPLPEWLNEGVAEVLSMSRSEILDRARSYYRSGALPDLRRIEATSPAGLGEAEVQSYYAAAAAMATALVDEAGWPGVWVMLQIKGKIPADLNSRAVALLKR